MCVCACVFSLKFVKRSSEQECRVVRSETIIKYLTKVYASSARPFSFRRRGRGPRWPVVAYSDSVYEEELRLLNDKIPSIGVCTSIK